MAVDVLVVQHAEKVREPGDPGLTDLGRVQAADVARWLERGPAIAEVWASPLRRALETAAPVADALGLPVRTDARLAERMSWDAAGGLSFEEFLAEWRRATQDRTHQPVVGDSSTAAAARFLEAVGGISAGVTDGSTVVVVSHGGVTVDALRDLMGDEALAAARPDLIGDGVPCGAVTRLQVDACIRVVGLPSTEHLDHPTGQRPV